MSSDFIVLLVFVVIIPIFLAYVGGIHLGYERGIKDGYFKGHCDGFGKGQHQPKRDRNGRFLK